MVYLTDDVIKSGMTSLKVGEAQSKSRFHCSLCPSRSHVHTSGTKPAICLLGFYVVSLILNALAKNIFPLIRQKIVLEENKERGNGP